MRKMIIAATLLLSGCYTTTYMVPGKKQSGKIVKTKYHCVLCFLTAVDEKGKEKAAGKLDKCKSAAVTIKKGPEDVLIEDVTLGFVQQRSVELHCAK